MDHHQREQRRAAAEAFNQSLEQLAACFHAEDLPSVDLSGADPLPPAANATPPGDPDPAPIPPLPSQMLQALESAVQDIEQSMQQDP